MEATEVDVQDNARGVPYLIARGGGRALLQVRMVTSEGRPLPQNQLDVPSEAIAAGSADNASQTREAMARFGVTR